MRCHGLRESFGLGLCLLSEHGYPEYTRDRESVPIRGERLGTYLFSEYKGHFALSVHLSIPNLDQRVVGLSLAESCRVNAIQASSVS